MYRMVGMLGGNTAVYGKLLQRQCDKPEMMVG